MNFKLHAALTGPMTIKAFWKCDRKFAICNVSFWLFFIYTKFARHMEICNIHISHGLFLANSFANISKNVDVWIAIFCIIINNDDLIFFYNKSITTKIISAFTA